MNNSDLTSIWRAVLGELEVSLSSAHYKTFLQNTDLLAVDNSVATVQVPNIFTKNWIVKKYDPQIVSALKKIVDDVVLVEYEIGAHSISPKITTKSEVDQPLPLQTTKTIPEDKPQPSSQSETKPSTSHLYEKYLFSNFVVGNDNQLAFAVSKTVAEKPGNQYNPLFLYGPAGVGKTHLMWAIISGINSHHPNLKTLYVTSEDFISNFISSVSKGGTFKGDAFAEKYRKVDVLLIDDIQFIAGKERTQEEFFHTFNALHQANKQIVICSDRPPNSIATLEDRLRSRFEWGMVADIQPPDLETRAAILTSKAASKDMELSVEVANYIASLFESNIRELEGALTRVMAFAQVRNEPLTMEITQQVLGTGKKKVGRSVTPKIIIEQTASYFDIKPTDLTGTKRDKQIAVPRQIAMYIMREELGMSFPQIAHTLGKRDHTTIIHGSKKIEKLINQGSPISEEIKTLKQRIFMK